MDRAIVWEILKDLDAVTTEMWNKVLPPLADNFGPDPDILKQQTRDARKANNEKKPPSFDETQEGQNLHRAFQK